MRSTVCVKETDRTVSREITVNGTWEREEVGFIIRAMRAYSDAVFIGRFVRVFVYVCVSVFICICVCVCVCYGDFNE